MKKIQDFVELPEILQEYLIQYLDSIKGKSERTAIAYATDLQLFFRFMVLIRFQNMDYRDITADLLSQAKIKDLTIEQIGSFTSQDAYRFLAYCKLLRENDAAARARKVVSIKRFYRYLSLDKKYMTENPMRDLESPKIGKRLPKYLTLEQSLELLQCIHGANRERDYCILTLFLNCGLRLSELVGLDLRDIRGDGTMRVIGKGNKERTIYLNPACVSALQNYLRVRPADGLSDRSALFISRNHNRISVRAVQNIVDKFLKKAGLADLGLSTHKLRHTAATLMYQYGNVDVLLLKEILGHENLSTTEIYTHIQNEQLRQAVQSNPLSALSPSESSASSEDQEN